MKTCQLICKSLTDISLSSCSWIIWVAVAATVISKVFAIFRLKLQIAKVSLIWILKNLLLLLHVRLYGFTTSGSGSISYFKCFCNFRLKLQQKHFPAQIAAKVIFRLKLQPLSEGRILNRNENALCTKYFGAFFNEIFQGLAKTILD